MEDNALMMRCTQCGEMNRLPVVHCKKCGAKLDFDAAEKRMMSAGEPTPAEQLRTAVKMAVALALAVVVLLAIWPGRMTRTTGEEIDARRYRLKVELLVDALNRDLPASQVLTEAEINAHLRELVSAQPPRSGWSARLKNMGVRLADGQVEAFVAVGRGPFTLTGRLVAKPKGDSLVVERAWAGHLPLPGVLGRLYARTRSGLLRQMKNESRVLRNLDGISAGHESIEVLIRAGK